MKSRSIIFIALASVSIMAFPFKFRAAGSYSGISVQSASATTISMETFRAGTLDRQGTLDLASKCLAAGQSMDELEIANKIVALYPNDEEVMRMSIRLFVNASQSEKALPLYEQLRSRFPDDIKLTLDAARAYSWAGRLAESQNLFNLVISSGNSNDLILSQYASVLYENKQYAKAVVQYRELWKKGSLQKKQAINFVYALMASGKQEESVKQLDSLAKLYPGDNEVLQATADVS